MFKFGKKKKFLKLIILNKRYVLEFMVFEVFILRLNLKCYFLVGIFYLRNKKYLNNYNFINVIYWLLFFINFLKNQLINKYKRQNYYIVNEFYIF